MEGPGRQMNSDLKERIKRVIAVTITMCSVKHTMLVQVQIVQTGFTGRIMRVCCLQLQMRNCELEYIAMPQRDRVVQPIYISDN